MVIMEEKTIQRKTDMEEKMDNKQKTWNSLPILMFQDVQAAT